MDTGKDSRIRPRLPVGHSKLTMPTLQRKVLPQSVTLSIGTGKNEAGRPICPCADAGRWMYPRAADLTSREVQRYSDRELFWIIKNGIRLSGMPAFAKVESDEHIWDIVFDPAHSARRSQKRTGQEIKLRT